MGKLGDAFWKIPWTTIIGAVMGTVTVWIITDGIIRMEKWDADYAGFVKEFISMSLVIESLAFAVYMGFRPKEELTRWSDSMIVYCAMALVVPASVFFSVIALVKVWENFLFDSILLHSALATWFTYTGIYCLMLKTARKAMILAD